MLLLRNKRQENWCEIFQSSLGFENCLVRHIILFVYQRCWSVQLRHQMEALLKVYRMLMPCERGGGGLNFWCCNGKGQRRPTSDSLVLLPLEPWTVWPTLSTEKVSPVALLVRYCGRAGKAKSSCGLQWNFPRCDRARNLTLESMKCLCLTGKKKPNQTNAAAREHMLDLPGGSFSLFCGHLPGQIEDCMPSDSWVPGRTIPTSYDMYSHLIILQKNISHIIPRHSGFVYFLLLVYYSLRYCSIQCWSKQHVIIALGGGGITATNLLWEKESGLV